MRSFSNLNLRTAVGRAGPRLELSRDPTASGRALGGPAARSSGCTEFGACSIKFRLLTARLFIKPLGHARVWPTSLKGEEAPDNSWVEERFRASGVANECLSG